MQSVHECPLRHQHQHLVAASFVRIMGFHNGQYGQQHSCCCTATCAIEMLERAPRDVSSNPLARFAHSAVAVPTNFGGKPSTVRSISLYTPRVPSLAVPFTEHAHIHRHTIIVW